MSKTFSIDPETSAQAAALLFLAMGELMEDAAAVAVQHRPSARLENALQARDFADLAADLSALAAALGALTRRCSILPGGDLEA